MNLSPKQKKFCAEYLKDLNAAQATIRAGYSKNRKTARLTGHRMITNDKVQKEIQRLMKRRSKRTEITQDRVLQELAALGFSNIKDYINRDYSTEGSIVFKNIDKISRKKASAIESIKVNAKEDRIEFKLHNKPKSIEMIGRHLGMFLDKVEHSGELKHAIFIMPRPGDREK